MLSIHFLNDGTGNKTVGNYNYIVIVNGKTLHNGKIKNHNRSYGWKGLLQDLLFSLKMTELEEEE